MNFTCECQFIEDFLKWFSQASKSSFDGDFPTILGDSLPTRIATYFKDDQQKRLEAVALSVPDGGKPNGDLYHKNLRIEKTQIILIKQQQATYISNQRIYSAERKERSKAGRRDGGKEQITKTGNYETKKPSFQCKNWI